MRGIEVTSIAKGFDSDRLVVIAMNAAQNRRHIFSVSPDGVHCKAMLVEDKGGKPVETFKHIPDSGWNIEVFRWGFGEQFDNVSGLYAMRQYRKVQKDVMAYVAEQDLENKIMGAMRTAG